MSTINTPINFGKKFDPRAAAAAVTALTGADQRPKATFWLNIGYVVPNAEENSEYNFVSLAAGIPLDTMQSLPTNSKNLVFGQFQAARNDLAAQLIELAKELAPGEAKVLPGYENLPLQIQLRRVGEEQPNAPTENNPFSRSIFAPATSEPKK